MQDANNSKPNKPGKKISARARRRKLRCVIVPGFSCPLCGGVSRFRVVKSIRQSGGKRLRHVVCGACSGKFALIVRGDSGTLWI